MSQFVHEHSLVLRRWLLDCLDSSWLWFAPMHHHRRHSLGYDALPADALGTGTIQEGYSWKALAFKP